MAYRLDGIHPDAAPLVAELYARIGLFDKADEFEPQPGVNQLYFRGDYARLVEEAGLLMIEYPDELSLRYLLAFALNVVGDSQNAIRILEAAASGRSGCRVLRTADRTRHRRYTSMPCRSSAGAMHWYVTSRPGSRAWKGTSGSPGGSFVRELHACAAREARRRARDAREDQEEPRARRFSVHQGRVMLPSARRQSALHSCDRQPRRAPSCASRTAPRDARKVRCS